MAGTVEAHTKYAAAETREEVNKHANVLHGKVSMTIAKSIVCPLDSMVGLTKNNAKATNSLTNTTTTQLAGLNRRVVELSG